MSYLLWLLKEKTKTKTQNLITIIILFAVTILAAANIAAAQTGTQGSLQITNASGKTISLSPADFAALPQSNVTASLFCYGALVVSGEWEGVKLSDLLNATGLDSTVRSVSFLAADGYTVSLPINYALQPTTIVANARDQVFLSEGLRLVLPDANGDLWIAQIINVTMNTASLNQPQVGSGNPTDSSSPSIKSGPSTTQQVTEQPEPLPSPTAPPSTPTIKPEGPSTNSTQPAPQQKTEQNEYRFSFQAFYVAAVIVVLAAILVTVVVVQKRRKSSA